MQRILPILALALLLPVSAHAGSFRLHGAYWDTDELGDTGGVGIAFSLPLAGALDLDLRAAYLQELVTDPFDSVFQDDEGLFAEDSFELTPIDVGLRFHLQRAGGIDPYFGGGLTYVFLDTDRRGVDFKDEVGYYAMFGARFGDNRGPAFFAEALYRKVNATAETRRGGVILNDEVDIDLDGLAINAGVEWTW